MTNSNTFAPAIAKNLQLPFSQVSGTLSLLEAGGTVPFIARYRKEATGSLDEVRIEAIRIEHGKLEDIEKRRQSIIDSLAKRDKLTNILHTQLKAADTLTTLEDIYLPHRQKRKTRALIAVEKGLQPLAELILSGKRCEPGVNDREEDLAGARDIIAEKISENLQTREKIRVLFLQKSIITSKVVKKNIGEGEKFSDYFGWQENVSKAPGHRLLAMFRGETLKILSLTVRPPQEEALRILHTLHAPSSPWQNELLKAVDESYKRLLRPSIENETRKELKRRADEEAIGVFAANLRQLLLAPALGQKSVLSLDPGYRTGAKLVCLDRQGKLLDTATIYPTHSARQQALAKEILLDMINRYKIEAIAIGNGTASRETEEFVRSLDLDSNIIITTVNEDGASIYSASETARLEFPDHDITVRGSVSIGRRLQDPLAELVKIEPKSIGVGQYQHDVDQTLLKDKLDTVVESCVNNVGVELNTASAELLTSVSGLGRTLADNILEFRNTNGPFKARRELLKVPRLGPKAYEQCAGFLRIKNGLNPLDNSGVHPERYPLIQRIADDADVPLSTLIQSEQARKDVNLKDYIDDSVGMPTLIDIIKELAKPGRDPRETFVQFRFADNIRSMDDLQEGMLLPAIITNVTNFGAFADIGIKQDGLIHISQLADRFIKDPGEIVQVGQQVKVRVLQVDIQRNRIALSLRKKDVLHS